jgi:hypothetical protein
MTRFFATPYRRITLAIVLSVLLHGLVLWLPNFQLPEHGPLLHTLEAKLIPLPKLSGKIGRHKHKLKPKIQPAPQPEPVAQAIPNLPAAASAPLAASEPVAASSAVAASEPVAASAPLAASEPVAAEPAASAPVATETEPQRPPLPKHAKLRFSVYIGQSGIKAGESVHTLDIVDGHYTLNADAHTTGLVQVFKTYHIEQTSSGTATKQTLKPESFTEVITQSSGKKTNRADFDWTNQKIHFTNGTEAALPLHALDILSTLYQFPPMREPNEIVSINIATGEKFETFRFQVDLEEQLKTAMGNLQTVHFRRIHKEHEEGLEIWFAQEYRLLPVKVRHLDRDGKIDGEAIITEIHVSDE